MGLDDLDAVMDEVAGASKANNDPFARLDSVMDEVVSQKKKRAATVTGIASSFNPDEIAQLRYLGKQTGIPDAIAERNPAEIKRKALSLKVESIYDNSPVLARKLSDPAFAKINHDIVDENSKIELSIKNLSLAAKPMRAAGNLVTDTNITNQLNPKVAPSRSLTEMMTDPLKSFAGGSNTMLAGFAELSRYSPQELVLQRALNAIAPSFAQARSEITDNAQQALNQGQEYWQQQKSDQVKEKLKAFNSAPIGESIAMLISNPDLLVDQLSQSIPYLVPGAGAARIGTGATAAYMTLSEAMDSANTARQEAIAAGASQDEQDKAAATAALVTAPLVFLGNKLVGADKLEQLFLSSGKVNVGLISAMVREAVSGSIEEGANQLGVNVGASNTFDPVRDLTQGVGKAMAIGGILESTQGAAMAGINYAAQAMGKVQNDSVQAESTMQAFANIQQLAEQSKLKQRSAQDFATFLQEAGGENGLDEVYIDARTFVEEAEKQGVDLNTLMQSSPVINQQLQEAIAQGVDLVIPVGEFGATIAGTEFGGAILQHLRADENGISAFEAQTQLDGAVEELQRQAEQVAQQYQDNEAWTQSIAEVSDNLLGQLNAVGRFTPQNNQAYVNGLVAPWYSTLASNLGITPAEAYARYPLQVSGNVTADGFEQNDIVGKNEALSSLSKLSQVVYDETYTPQDAYDALYEAANPKQKTVLRALSKEQMLGFEYPHQALDELRRNPEAYQTSPAFKGILTKAGNNQFNQSESQVDTPEFKKWFGDSKVVDADGKPLVMYHGTQSDFAEFNTDVIFATSYKETANIYARSHSVDGGRIMPVYVAAKKVFDTRNETDREVFENEFYRKYGNGSPLSDSGLPDWTDAEDFKQFFEDNGYDYDAVYIQEPQGNESIAVFSPSQIKSAIGNRGTFDPNDANILNQADNFTAWAGTDKPVIEPNEINDYDFNGNGPFIIRGYHGTTNTFSEFNASIKGNMEGQFGSVNYFTSSFQDANDNYAGEGPDLTQRIELKAERIADDIQDVIDSYDNEEDGIAAVKEQYGDDVYSEDTMEMARNIVRKELHGGDEKVIEVYIRTDKPFVAGDSRSPFMAFINEESLESEAIERVADNNGISVDDVRADFDTYTDEIDDARYEIMDESENPLVTAIQNVADKYDFDPSDILASLYEVTGDGSVRHANLESELRKLFDGAYIENPETGDLISSQVLGEVIQELGFDSIILKNADKRFKNMNMKDGTVHIHVFDANNTNIKSATDNNGNYDSNNPNIYEQKANESARGQISFSNDITQGANITLLKNADASTFIHELGHFFLEVYADVASKPDAPQVIVDDMNQLFNWFGIESTEQPAIDVWRNMNIEQKRAYHEKLARGFEQYALEGTAPTLELSRVFAKLRSFMLSAYKSLKQFFERSGEPGLTPEVRQVFDRMLASDDAINKAQAVRGMMPMFASMEEAGMSVDEYAEYLQNQQDATDEAKAQLIARSLRDMKWLQGARSRVLRDLQRQADAERRAVRMQVRREVMTQPVYQAYSWLKQIPDETKAQQAEKVKATKGVDVEKDSLYTAIAKLGGLNRELAASEWGIDPKDKFDSGVFGKPVLRKEGGLSVDAMAEALAQYEYLTLDENGKWDLREFEDKFFEEARGERQYSLFAEGEQYRKWQESIYDEQERARLDAFGKGKLDLSSMKAMYGEDGDWRNLGIGRTGMVMTDGVAPDAVAELFGFNSGDHLVKSLLAAENPKELVERMTNERMLAEFGDLVDAKKMNEAADKAVHNEVRARVLATELSAQNKALGNRRILEAAAKEYANRQIAGTLVRDLKSSKYTRAESKSAKLADKATRKGDTQTAVQAKRDQLLNNRAAKATLDANDKVEATLKYLKKFDSEGVRKNLDIDYIEQIDDILTRFDLRSGQSLRAIDKRKSLLQWVEGQKEIGLSPVIDEDLLNEARRTSYKDLPFEQFMALADSIRNIEHLGRLKKTLLTAKDKREFAEHMAEARESINNNGNRIVPERATPNDFIGKTARFGRRFSAAHRKFSSFMRELDGGKDLGVMQDMLLYTMYEAGSLETDLRAKATDDMQRLFATIEGTLDKAVGNLYAIKRIVPGTNISLTHEQRIMFAMNWGNDGNRQRLLDGGLEGTRSISNEEASAILDTITKDEWDFIQGTWDYIATFKPMIAEQERKLTGREPVWIDPSPVNTKYGTYAGGYFPAKYDAQMSTRSESLEAVTDLRMAMKGAFNSSGTRDGYTQARAEAVKGRPILLSFDTISRHIHEVTHRLAWQEWLTDATRVVTALDGDIRERLGAEALQEIHQHIRDVAIGDAPVTGTTDVLLSRIRTGTSIVGMGYRVSTALLQPSGIFQSWGRLGLGAVANGIKTVLKNPVKTHEWVMENSPMMRNRARTLNREINEIVNQVRAGKNLTTLQASYFYMISKMQIMIDMPTYVGAYEKALGDLEYEKAGSEDERKAIEAKAHSFAGQTVIDTQTGGEIKDLAGVQKGSQGQKLFTNFYSYFSALYNLNVENYRTKKLTNPAEFADFVATALLLNVMPVMYSVALKNLLKGECDWDDTECLLGRYKSEQMSAIFGQIIGVRDAGIAVDVATGGDAFGYSGPPSLKFFSELYKLGQQSGQGEVDMPLFKALNNAGGILFHYPAGQINSTVEGMIAIERGEVDGVNIFGALISGPPKD